jgi:hypothetical protein
MSVELLERSTKRSRVRLAIHPASRKGQLTDSSTGHLPFLFSAVDLLLLGSTRSGGYAGDLLRLDSSVLRSKVWVARTGAECAEALLDLGLQDVQFGSGLFAGRDEFAGTLPSARA